MFTETSRRTRPYTRLFASEVLTETCVFIEDEAGTVYAFASLSDTPDVWRLNYQARANGFPILSCGPEEGRSINRDAPGAAELLAILERESD